MCLGGQSDLDSLEKAHLALPDDTAKVEHLINLGFEYHSLARIIHQDFVTRDQIARKSGS